MRDPNAQLLFGVKSDASTGSPIQGRKAGGLNISCLTGHPLVQSGHQVRLRQRRQQ